MFHQLLQAFNSTTDLLFQPWKRGFMSRRTLFIFIATLVVSFVQIPFYQQEAYADEQNVNYHCSYYTIRPGDTLSAIAAKGHVDMLTLARVNHILNVNLIFAARSLCLPQGNRGMPGQLSGSYSPGILSNGAVRWYDYDALEGSNYYQVDTLLRRAAAFYGLSANLVIAIARQESGFRQHVIAQDGGIGVMQLMPSTASWINTMTGTERDPYKLRDNIFMGVFYVRMLGDTFHWNTVKLVSAYNEGPWAVSHQGVMNWSYVNNVLSMAGSA
jgi:Transglycosylase SLT domain/LysM domain